MLRLAGSARLRCGRIAFSADGIHLTRAASALMRAAAIHNRGYNRASVCFSVRDVEIDESGVEIVRSAQIDHISLTNRAAYGGHTGCWDAGRPINPADYRLLNMAARWEAGFKAHRAKLRVENKPAPSTKRPALSTEALAAEHRLRNSLAAYQGGHPYGARFKPEPRPKSGRDLSTIAGLFKAIFASRDRHAERLAELERRVAELENERE